MPAVQSPKTVTATAANAVVPDPIFEAIARHTAALQTLDDVCAADGSDDAVDAAAIARERAMNGLICGPAPTTMAGVIALLQHVAWVNRHYDEPFACYYELDGDVPNQWTRDHGVLFEAALVDMLADVLPRIAAGA